MKITTHRTTCHEGPVCPAIHSIDADPDHLYIVLKKVADPAVVESFAHLVGQDEVLGYAPRTLIPEV